MCRRQKKTWSQSELFDHVSWGDEIDAAPARAKKFATTAEAMLANWVQRHAAFLSQNPAWRTYKYGRTYKYAGKKKKKRNIADEETTRKLIAALEEESIKYETYFKLIIATGMRRGLICR